VLCGALALSLHSPAPAAALSAAQQSASFPRLTHWWGGSPTSDNAKRDYYAPYNDEPLAPDTSVITGLRSTNPGIILLASSSAAELDYSPTNERAFDSQRAAAIPTSWLLTQVGSTLTSPLSASSTSVSVADTSKFRTGDLIVVDDERCIVTGVGS